MRAFTKKQREARALLLEDPADVRRRERLERRAAARAAAAKKTAERRAWFFERKEAGKKRAQERARELRRQERGAHRVPEHLQDLYPTFEPHTVGKKSGVPIDSSLGTSVIHGVEVTQPYRIRRAMGARGHRRKPRRRELPGAVQRRIERNKAEAVDW